MASPLLSPRSTSKRGLMVFRGCIQATAAIFIYCSLTIPVSANPCPTSDRYAKPPDGCSSWSDNPRQFRDQWGPVDFTQACMAHDRCYYTLGTGEARCNDAFLRDLLAACKEDLRLCTRFGGRMRCLPADPASFSACSAFATGMVALVRAASPWVYREAQRSQRDHERQCKTLPDNCSSLRGRWLMNVRLDQGGSYSAMISITSGYSGRWQQLNRDFISDVELRIAGSEVTIDTTRDSARYVGRCDASGVVRGRRYEDLKAAYDGSFVMTRQ